MAIYHLHAKVIQRSKGKNAVAAIAYRRAAKLYDEKEGKVWDYTNKPDVIHTEMIVPKDSPAWVNEFVDLHQVDPSKAAEKLWNMVEACERRIDSQLAREIEFALPIELSEEQNIQLAREFIQDQFALRGMIADWSVHWDDGNPHVHVMLTMRHLGEEGFGKRVLEWNSKILLQEWREKWAEYANFHLRLHQHDVKIDHRSYREQGIDLVPTIHQGKAVSDMDRRGIVTNIMREANDIRRENLSRISANPEILFSKLSSQSETFTSHQVGQELGRYINDKGKFSHRYKGFLANEIFQNIEKIENEIRSGAVLTPETIAKIIQSIEHHESVFNERILAKSVAPFTQNAEQFAKAIMQIKTSGELLYLGAGDDGRDRFTTRKMFNLENEVQKVADIMRDSRHVKISSRVVNDILERHQIRTDKRLTDEQMRAVKHILRSSSISCLVGRAGTGKSFSLGAAKAVWEAKGLRVQGIALSGIAADGLNKDAGIQSRTIESFRYSIEKGIINLNHHDVIVMDEAGMTDSVSMMAVLKAVRAARAKLVLVGDHAQIQPVGPGASFRALLERLGFTEIQTVYRQKEQWQRDATAHLSSGRVADALTAYEAHDCIHFARTELDAMSLLVNDWLTTRINHPKDFGQYLVIAHRNEDVNSLNTLLRSERVRRGEITEGYTANAKLGEMKLAQGDRILFLKNDRRLGVSNGRFATIKRVNFTESGKVINFTVILDGENKEVCINPSEYRDFAYGYAATVHKVQGMTVDHAFVYAGGSSWNRHLTYVALSRHRKTCHLYAGKDVHQNREQLERHLGRLGIKDSLLDFPLAFSERRGIDTSSLLKLLPKHLSQRLKIWKEKLADQIDQFKNPERYAERLIDAAYKKMQAEEIRERREDARLVASYVDLNRDVGMSWQSLQTKLNVMGLDSMSYEKNDFMLISGIKEYSLLQAAMTARNQAAYQIMREPSRYKKAIEIYEIDLNKLKKQSEQYSCYEQVKSYASAYNRGAVVHRDRLAAVISQNIKAHYPYLQSYQLKTGDLKVHGLSHHKRQLFKTLTPNERSAFKMVETYQSAAQEVGAWWTNQIKAKELLKHSALQRLEMLSRKRDRLAYEIMKDRTYYGKALDFYQIGIAAPKFGETPTEEILREAEARWYRLQQQAARHELHERVEGYHHALFLGDLNKRMQFAYEIMQATSDHHAAVVGLGVNTQEVWRAIRRDAKLYDCHNHYCSLDLISRSGFKTVESYVEAKRSSANAWRELFESRKTANIDDKTFYSTLSSYATRYTIERDKYAAKILENISIHQAGLNYFKVSLEELQKEAYKQQCRMDVEDYLKETNFLSRAQYASKIIADPKNHHGFVIENKLNWRQIYRDARISERKQLFARLSIEEKALYRLADRYREANRKAGQLISHLKSSKLTISFENSQRINHFFAKRDYLAWRLVNIARTHDLKFLGELTTAYHLNADKLLQQHTQHTDRLTAIERYQSAYQNVLLNTREINQNLGKAKEVSLHLLQNTFTSIDIALSLQKIYRLDNLESFDYVLQAYGLSKENLNKQIKGLASLKNHLHSLTNLNKQNVNQLIEKQSAKVTSILGNKPITYQRIDIKRLRDDLNARAEEVVQHYLGNPKIRSGSTLRYGTNKGSLVVNIRGQKQGLWRDFQTGEGGDMLNLIQHAMETSNFKDVLQEATRFLSGYSTYTHISSAKVIQNKETDLDSYTLQKIKKARDIYRATKSIEGTLAERYLREHRGIQGALYDKTFRYHPNLKNWMTGETYPALIVAARDDKDKVCGIQAIFLDSKTATKASVGHHAKLSRGLIGEGALVHPGLPSGKIAFAEGPETALSVACAHPDWTVYVTFGVSNFDKVPLKDKSKHIVICADNDGPDSATAKGVERAANILARKGIDVWVAEPKKSDDLKKWDFNDSLIMQGISQVREDLDNAVLYRAGMTQDKIKKDIEETLNIITKPTQEFEIPMNQKIESQEIISVETKDASFEAILTRYVDLELEQTRLVDAMHMARSRDPKAGRELSVKALTHSSNIKAFAVEAIQHAEIKAELEKLKNVKASSLAQRGGFIAISERISKGEWLREDIQTILVQLRGKAQDQSRSRTQDRDRGGRSR